MFEVTLIAAVLYLLVRASAFWGKTWFALGNEVEGASTERPLPVPPAVRHNTVLRPGLRDTLLIAVAPPLGLLVAPIVAATWRLALRPESTLRAEFENILNAQRLLTVVIMLGLFGLRALVEHLRGYRIETTDLGFEVAQPGHFARRWSFSKVRSAAVRRWWGVPCLVLEMEQGRAVFPLWRYRGLVEFFGKAAPEGHPLRSPTVE